MSLSSTQKVVALLGQEERVKRKPREISFHRPGNSALTSVDLRLEKS